MHFIYFLIGRNVELYYNQLFITVDFA